MAHLGMVDDRALTELLKEIKDFDADGLLGTGFDEMMLANLVFVTRSTDEIADFDAAAEWVGLPEYEDPGNNPKIILNFQNEDDRTEFIRKSGIGITKAGKSHKWTAWWPPRERNDLSSIQFDN